MAITTKIKLLHKSLFMYRIAPEVISWGGERDKSKRSQSDRVPRLQPWVNEPSPEGRRVSEFMEVPRACPQVSTESKEVKQAIKGFDWPEARGISAFGYGFWKEHQGSIQRNTKGGPESGQAVCFEDGRREIVFHSLL